MDLSRWKRSHPTPVVVESRCWILLWCWSTCFAVSRSSLDEVHDAIPLCFISLDHGLESLLPPPPFCSISPLVLLFSLLVRVSNSVAVPKSSILSPFVSSSSSALSLLHLYFVSYPLHLYPLLMNAPWSCHLSVIFCRRMLSHVSDWGRHSTG